MWISIHSRFSCVYFDPINSKGSLQPKLKGASVWPFNARSEVLQAESVIYDHCTGNVKKKLIKVNCSEIYGNFYMPWLSRAGF